MHALEVQHKLNLKHGTGFRIKIKKRGGQSPSRKEKVPTVFNNGGGVGHHNDNSIPDHVHDGPRLCLKKKCPGEAAASPSVAPRLETFGEVGVA